MLDAVLAKFGVMGVQSLLFLIANPIVYIATALIIWDLFRNVRAERQFFGIRLTRIWKPLIYRYLKAICVGLILTAISLYLNVEITFLEAAVVTGLTLVLACCRLRLMATTYPVGLLILLSAWTHIWIHPPQHWLVSIWGFFLQVHMESWVAVLALTYLGQFLMTLLHRSEGLAPILLHSRRGRGIGAFVFQLVFVMPIGLFFPGTMSVSLHFAKSFSLLPQGATVSGGALPLLVGQSGVLAATDVKQVQKRLLLDSVIGMILFFGILFIPVHTHLLFSALAGLLAILLPEWTIFQWKWRENHADPICAPTMEGVTVLFAIKGSLAERLGIMPGEVITQVNQVPVHSEYDLHFAIDQNPAYVKLQVRDRRGELRIVGSPIYEGGRHQIGLILAPTMPTDVQYGTRSYGLFQTLYLKLTKNSKNASSG